MSSNSEHVMYTSRRSPRRARVFSDSCNGTRREREASHQSRDRGLGNAHRLPPGEATGVDFTLKT